MLRRFLWITSSLIILSACNQAVVNPATNNDNFLKTVADSYTFSQSALSLVGKDNGVLVNDTLPQTFELTVHTQPQHGTLELKGDGSFSYQHDGSETSADSFDYTLSASGKTSTASVALTITAKSPNAPTANADTYTLDEGATLTVNTADGLLKNDMNPLSSNLTASVVEVPKHGSLTLNPDGSFTYTHDHSETTEDSFIYSVSSGQETGQAKVILTVTPVEDVPMITKLELVQTHLIPAEGKSWSGENFKNYNLHLVGNRDALVFVDMASANDRVVDAVVEAYVNRQKLGEVALNTPDTLPKTEANGPAYSTTSSWANLDKSWIKPGLELRVRANEGQYAETKPVKVGAPGEFTMYTLPFYLFGLDETDISLGQVTVPDKATQDEYFAKHPFAKFNIVNHAAGKIIWPYIVVGPREGRSAKKVDYKEQQGDTFAVMSAVLDTLQAIRSANGDKPLNVQYYAPLLMATTAAPAVVWAAVMWVQVTIVTRVFLSTKLVTLSECPTPMTVTRAVSILMWAVV